MIDLHMHTKYSDGTDEATQILENAEKNGLEIISITDHNTVDCYKVLEHIEVKKYYTGKIIPGIELNTKVLGVPIEILGYGFDYKIMDDLLEELYIPVKERNKKEVERLYLKCINMGIKLEADCLNKYDGDTFASKFIQTEIKKFEENKAIISNEAWDDSSSFYRRYMSNPKGPLYVEMDDFVPDFNKAAEAIRKAGGLVFIPHIFEYLENSRKILEYILENYKFDGIECYYTTFSEEQTKELLALCKEKKLYVSSGSDYHGVRKPSIEIGKGYGNLCTHKEVIDDWIDKVRTY